MDDILNETVSTEDLKKFETAYHLRLKDGTLDSQTEFEYAWCLVRSRYPADIKKGIIILEDLFQKADDKLRRDCLYYLALGNARIKEYSIALNFVRAFLQIEPTNNQVLTLEAIIKKKMEREGLKGIAIAGGAILAIGGLLGLGIAVAKGK